MSVDSSTRTVRMRAGSRGLLLEFRAFAMRGNILDLAVGVVMGVAFGAVVTSLVNDLLMPPIGALVGGKDFSALAIEIGGAEIRYGNFINTVINFLIVAAALFVIVKTVSQLQRAKPDAVTKDCPFCYSAIPIPAIKCPACTSDLTGAEAAAAFRRAVKIEDAHVSAEIGTARADVQKLFDR